LPELHFDSSKTGSRLVNSSKISLAELLVGHKMLLTGSVNL
jgi:hypothetical protein